MVNDFSKPSVLQNVSAAFALAARCSFTAVVILIPFRYRIVLLARPAPPIYDDYTDFLFFAADAALLVTFTLWIISLSLRPRKLALGSRHIWIPLVGLTLAGWVSAASSYAPALSVYHAIRLIALLWFYVFMVNEIHDVRWVLIPVGVQITIQSVVALAQFIAQRSVDLQLLGELYLDPSWSGIGIVVANGVRLLRAYGLSDHPNILGGCLALGLLLLLAAYLHGVGFQQPWRALIPIAFLPAIPALLVTFSRSAWLAFVIGAVIIVGAEFVNRRRNWMNRLLWLASLCMMLLSPFLLAYARFFSARLNANNSFSSPSVEQQAIGERTLLIDSTMPLFLKHPWLGVGLGASPFALQASYPVFPVDYQPPHLAILLAAMETGLLGTASYSFLMIAPFVIFFMHRESLLSNPLATTAAALLVSLGIIGLFDYYTWLLVPGRLWQWLAWGLWAIAERRAPDSENSSSYSNRLSVASLKDATWPSN